VQVADRFHLLANAGDTLERVLARKHEALRKTAAMVDRENAAGDVAPTRRMPPLVVAAPKPLTKHKQQTHDRRARRQARYEEVMRLFEQGMAIRAIGRQVRLSRKTVERYLRASSFPQHSPRRPRPSILSPYESYLRERWTTGCHNARVLWEEIQAQGFTGAASLVRRFVATWRTRPGRPGPRARAALLLECPEAGTASALVEEFGRLVRERDHATLNSWLDRAGTSGVPEMREFASGISRDKAAVDSALSYEWSSGQTEGHVNRLKFLKRQMYGRASFALLKRRVLRAA
jgi:transposase